MMPRPKKKTDLEREAGLDPQEASAENNKKGAEYSAITNKLANQRLVRLRHQNSKLSLELKKLRGQVGDVDTMRREVLAANAVVKQQVLAVPVREGPRVGLTPEQIKGLSQALVECLNDLAYEREKGDLIS